MSRELIALTGSTGRVGPFVARELLKRGHRLRLLVRKPGDAQRLFGEWISKGRAEVVRVDLVLATNGDLEQLLGGCQSLVHLAALVDFALPWEAFMLANYEVTRKLASAARKAGVKRFVHASSIAVYGKPRNGLVGESEPLNPESPYGWSKLFAEDAVKRSGLEHVILRPGIVYGPGIEEGFVSVARAVQQGKMRLIGSGENRIPLVHAQDLARAFALALDSPKAKNEVFNVSGPPATQRQLLNLLARELGATPVERSTPRWAAYGAGLWEEVRARLARRRPRFSREYVRIFSEDRSFSTKRIERALGWRARVTPEQGVREFVRWLRSHPTLRA